MKTNKSTQWLVLLLTLSLCALTGYAGNDGTDPGGNQGDGCGAENDCISLYISTGPMRNHVNLPSGMIGFMSETPSDVIATPQALKVVSGMYGILNVAGNEVYVMNNYGSKLTFTFPTGSATATTSGEDASWHLSLKKVDADGNLSVSNAVTYDLYTFDGLERVRFCAVTTSTNYLRMVDCRTPEGQVYHPEDIGVDYIYDYAGALRQVMAPTRFLDIVNIFWNNRYNVFVYEPEDVAMGANGLYEVLPGAEPVEEWLVNCISTWWTPTYDITHTIPGGNSVTRFVYDSASQTWTSTEDGGLTFEKTSMVWDYAHYCGVRTKTWLAAEQAPVAKEVKYLCNKPWGRVVEAQEDYISSSAMQRTDYTYYEGTNDLGYRKLNKKENGDGTWVKYQYDSLGRKTVEISSWKDVVMTTDPASAKAVYYDYTPHETSDVPLEYDERPRTVTEKIEGIITKKTFYTYKTNSVGAQVHITEECVDPDAEYGDASNLRTTKTFYPPYEGENFQDRLNQGRIKTIEYPDGQLETYSYALGNLNMNYSDPSASAFTAATNGLDWQETVIHGTVDHPEGIANQTTKEVVVLDKYSNVALTEIYVYNGTGYERISWIASKFDVHGHELETWYSDGTQESGFWGTGCCGKDSGTDRDGIKTTYAYDLNRRMTSEVKLTTNDTAGVTQEYTYDAKGRRLSTTRSATGIAPLTESFSYDMLGRMLQRTAEDGTVTQWSYDDVARTITETQPGGATRVTTKYADGQIKSIVGTAVVAVNVEYGVNADGTKWIKKYTGPDGTSSPAWEKVTTDLLGRIVKTEKPGFDNSTLVTENVYNSKGQLEKTIKSALTGSTTSTISTVIFNYNELGEMIRSGIDVDKNGALTLASMDRIQDTVQNYVKENGDWFERKLQIIYPQDSSSTALTNSITKTRLTGLGTQSAFGNLQSEIILTDRFSKQTVTEVYVNRANRSMETKITHPDSASPEIIRSSNGLTTAYYDPRNGGLTTFGYDALERPVEQRSDSAGGPRSVATISHYNVKGQIDWQEDGATNRTSFAYDSATGRKTAETNALAGTTAYTYNDRGQVASVGGTSQYLQEYGYDAFGRMTDLYTKRSVTTDRDRTQWIYDQATGLVTQKLYDNGKGPSYTYTPDGKLATRTWARTAGVSPALPLTTTYSYDSLGQLTGTVYSDGTPSVAITYNRMGQKSLLTDASGSTDFYYNNRLQLVNELNAYDLTRSYDAFGRPTGIMLDDAAFVSSYSYDTYGRFSSVTSSVRAATDVVSAANYSYIPGTSLLSGYTASAGGSAASLTVSKTYEPNRNLLTAITNTLLTGSTPSTVSTFSYTYDALGRRTQRTDLRPLGLGSSANSFAYNARSELTSADMNAEGYWYAYDGIGNRLTASTPSTDFSYTANELNQYTTQTIDNSSTKNFTYDDDGNLLSDGVRTYTWDGENRLKTVQDVQPGEGSKRLEFKYDAQGRRFNKKVYQLATGNWELETQTQFVYDGWNLISEVELNAQSQFVNHKCYTWGLDLSGTLQGAGGVGGLLSQTVLTPSTASTFLTTCDANGNVTEYISTDGTVAAHFEYDPYGNTISETISTGLTSSTFSFRFSTKYLDSETGLYYYGYRYYSPVLGRWLGRDPLEEKGGLNLNAFCRNNPVNGIDPLGLDGKKCDKKKQKKLARQARAAIRAELKKAERQRMDLKYARDAIETNPNLTDKQRQDMLDKLDSKIDELNSKIDIINFFSTLLGRDPAWFRPEGEKPVMGREGWFIFDPNSPLMVFLDSYFPNGHEFARTHDSWLDAIGSTGNGFSDFMIDLFTNVPSMPLAYAESFIENTLHTLSDVGDFFNPFD